MLLTVIVWSPNPVNQESNTNMNQRKFVPTLLATLAGVCMTSQAALIVEDTWIDGTRNDPAQPVYSEAGTDTDGDGNLESAWYHAGNAGTSSTVINANPGFSPGILRTTVGSGNNFTANAADYLSILEAAAKAPRQPDGSLPTGFAQLVAGSDLIDKGANVSLPFNGTAPDLGPYEAP